jgi:hypothetical protein
MKKLLITAIALLSLNLCKADITIYKLTDSARQIGSGQDTRVLLTGSVAFDEPGTNGIANAMVVWTYRVAGVKYFQVVPHAFNVSQTAGRIPGTSWTVFREYHPITNSVTGESYILAYGQNVALTTSPGNTVSKPRVMTAKPQEIAFGTNGLILDSTLNLVFDSKDTLGANAQSLTINDVATSLRQKYLSLGYTESSPYW